MFSKLKRSALVPAMCVLTLTLAVVGCSKGSTGNKEKRDVQVMTEAQMTEKVNQLADEIVTVTGATKTQLPANSAPCDNSVGDNSEQVRYVQGAYRLQMSPDQHTPALVKARDHWKAQGWTITDDRTTEADGRGNVSAKAPKDGFTFSLQSTGPKDDLGLIIASSCYRDPTYK